MTPDEIKRAYKGGDSLTDDILAEIAIQLAELKEEVAVGLERLNERLNDYFTIQVDEEIEKGKR